MPILSKFLIIPLLLLARASAALAEQNAALQPLLSVVEAERNFARAGLERGIRDSFLANFSEDGIVFAPEPTNAKKFYSTYVDKGRRLIWQPIFATVARSGDIGFTTGPWELKTSATDDAPLGFGQFVSVWKKQADNSWKVLVDVGIDNPQPAEPPGEIQLLPPGEATPQVDLKVRQQVLAKAEKTLLEALKSDAGAAVLAASAEDLRVFRDNSFPAVGKTAAKILLGSDHAKTTRQSSGGGLSAAGDLAYRYGFYSSERGNLKERGQYLSLWQVDLKGSWKILIDLQKKTESK